MEGSDTEKVLLVVFLRWSRETIGRRRGVNLRGTVSEGRHGTDLPFVVGSDRGYVPKFTYLNRQTEPQRKARVLFEDHGTGGPSPVQVQTGHRRPCTRERSGRGRVKGV